MLNCFKHQKQVALLNIIILYLTLHSSYASFFWGMPILIHGAIIISTDILCYIVLKKNGGVISKNGIFAAFFFFLFCTWQTNITIYGFFFLLFESVIVSLIVSLPLHIKKNILDFQTGTMAFLLLLSLSLWLINYIYPIPSYGIIYRSGFDDTVNGFTNYGFFIVSAYHALDIRFHAFFLEPGHLGVIIAFLIFANQYNYRKKSIIVFTLILLFTMSVAGYLLFFVGYLLLSLKAQENSKGLKRLLLFGIFVFLFFQIALVYNGGDNYINELIIERLEMDDSGFAGDNRTSSQLYTLYDKMWSDGSILTGISFESFMKLDDTSAGLITLIVQKGLIGVMLIFMAYFFMSKEASSRKWAWIVLLFYAISSYQRTYFTWFSYIIPFICCSYLPNLNTQIYIDKKKKDKFI